MHNAARIFLNECRGRSGGTFDVLACLLRSNTSRIAGTPTLYGEARSREPPAERKEVIAPP